MKLYFLLHTMYLLNKLKLDTLGIILLYIYVYISKILSYCFGWRQEWNLLCDYNLAMMLKLYLSSIIYMTFITTSTTMRNMNLMKQHLIFRVKFVFNSSSIQKFTFNTKFCWTFFGQLSLSMLNEKQAKKIKIKTG